MKKKEGCTIYCLLVASFLLFPFFVWGIELPSSTIFPMKVGMTTELTNTRGDVLRWEVASFTILNDEDTTSDVQIEWKLKHSGNFSFVYRVAFVVTLDGWVYLDSLSDGFQVRSFVPGLALFDPEGKFVESVLGEGIAVVKPARLSRFTWGRPFQDVVAATLVIGNHRIKLFWEKSRGLIGVDAGVPYYLR